MGRVWVAAAAPAVPPQHPICCYHRPAAVTSWTYFTDFSLVRPPVAVKWRVWGAGGHVCESAARRRPAGPQQTWPGHVLASCFFRLVATPRCPFASGISSVSPQEPARDGPGALQRAARCAWLGDQLKSPGCAQPAAEPARASSPAGWRRPEPKVCRGGSQDERQAARGGGAERGDAGPAQVPHGSCAAAAAACTRRLWLPW